jgi:hypothetical protein
MTDSTELDAVRTELISWYESYRRADGLDPDRYVVCAGLAVLEDARYSFPLKHSDFITPKSQVKTGGPFIKAILARFGEDRLYASEGGRTTRGTLTAAEQLAERLNKIGTLSLLSCDERLEIIEVDHRGTSALARR